MVLKSDIEKDKQAHVEVEKKKEEESKLEKVIEPVHSEGGQAGEGVPSDQQTKERQDFVRNVSEPRESRPDLIF